MLSRKVLEIWLERWGKRYPLSPNQKNCFLARESVEELCKYEERIIRKVVNNNQKLEDALFEAESNYGLRIQRYDQNNQKMEYALEYEEREEYDYQRSGWTRNYGADFDPDDDGEITKADIKEFWFLMGDEDGLQSFI